MDSLTQIVLGAATGEVVLGKKLGNRAMLWGAVGGTIPDLDVVSGLFMTELNSLAFHRGISHSLFFSVFGAFAIGWLVHHLYKSPYHKWFAILGRLLAAVVIAGIATMFFKILAPDSIIPIVISIVTASLLFIQVIRRKYFSGNWTAPDASLREWQWLFFWSLLTHPILDCFTMYGTQLFAPFSNYRVAWSTISVADPAYTVPFIICLFVASLYNRQDSKRRFWNYLGIGLSSLYLLFTVFNKQKIDKVFAEALQTQNIPADRFLSNPYILNNILWTATAEADDVFYQAQYSLFDEQEISFTPIEKDHDLINNIDEDHTIKTLRWFSDDYFNITQLSPSKFQFNDLRFGTFSGTGSDPNDFIFKFELSELPDGSYEMKNAQGGPPEGSEKEMMSRLWTRILGNKKSE